MMKLSKYEKETIINWNEGETIASIYTFNASLKRRLEDFSRKYPLLCRLERSTPEGSVTYVLDKSRLSIRLMVINVFIELMLPWHNNRCFSNLKRHNKTCWAP